MKVLLLVLIALFSICYGIFLVRDVWRHRSDLKCTKGRAAFLAGFSTVVQFFATFGVSDFAVNTFVFRKLKLVSDEKLPGTLNTACCIPVAAMVLCYITTVSVELPTLLSCIAAQTIGTLIGVKFVVNLPINRVRLLMGASLIGSGGFMLLGKLGVIPQTGSATGLPLPNLIAACLLLALYGALNAVGFGSTAPSLATLYSLGLDPLSAFPVVMGAAAFATTAGGIKFIRSGLYERKVTVASSVFGVVGVFIAVKIVKNLNVNVLQWAVAILIVYSGYTFLRQVYPLDLAKQRE